MGMALLEIALFSLSLRMKRPKPHGGDNEIRQIEGTMAKRTNYYKDLAADYSQPSLVAPEVAKKLIADAERFIAMKDKTLPEMGPNYPLEQMEKENKEWWPTHCEALRQGRGDILTGEYRDDLVYFSTRWTILSV